MRCRPGLRPAFFVSKSGRQIKAIKAMLNALLGGKNKLGWKVNRRARPGPGAIAGELWARRCRKPSPLPAAATTVYSVGDQRPKHNDKGQGNGNRFQDAAFGKNCHLTSPLEG
jgi:hypothetical protein